MKKLLLLYIILIWALPALAQVDTTWLDEYEKVWSLRDRRSIEMARQYREDRFDNDRGKRFSYGSNFADSLTYVSSALWSGVEDVKVVHGYAYCCLRNGLVIVDVSDSTKPSFVSKLYLPCGYRNYIDIDPTGNYVYMPSESDLCIIDVTNNINPHLVTQYKGGYYMDAVVGDDNIAYLLSYSKLQVLDVSHKDNPQPKGSLTLEYSGYVLCVRGSFAYVLGYQYYPSINYNLQIINVFDENSPTFVNSFVLDTSSGYYPSSLFVSGNYAYIAEGKGLQIVDVSNLNNLHEEARLDTLGAEGIFISNQLAYAITFYSFWIADVSIPKNPKYKGQCYTYGWGEGVYGLGDVAYVADGPYGLTIIDASDEQNPDIVGKYTMPYLTFNVQAVGNYAFTANGSAGLQIVDISDKTKPSRVGEYDTPGWSQGVFVRDTLAYVADEYNGLQIINVSNPAAPRYFGGYNTPGSAQDVFVLGNYAYIADYGSGLQILNVSNPSVPSSVGSYVTPGVYAYAVFVKDNIAYVAAGDSGLQIINVANPSDPSKLGIYRKMGYAYDVFVRDSLAYVAGDSVYILNIAHPSDPRLVNAIYNGYGAGMGICVTGNYAYVTSWSGISIVDVSDPSNMQLLERYDTPGMAEGVSVLDGYVYVADWFSLMILKHGGVVPQTVQVNSPNGGENWCTGSTHNITWSCSGMDQVKIEHSTDGGSTWMAIIDSSPCASKSYSWNIPDTISTNCLVRVCDEADNSPCDYSNSRFTISRKPDTVELVSPSNKTVEVPIKPVHLRWSTAQDADSYHLQVDNDSIFKSLLFEKYGITEIRCYVPGLDSGITYYWRVSAINGCGAGEWSDIWRFTAGSEALATIAGFLPVDYDSVDYRSSLVVTFSKYIDPNTINKNNLSIKGLKNYTWNFFTEDSLTFLFTPDSGFYSLDTVSVVLTGKIKDTHGRGLDLNEDGVANDSNKFITKRFYVYPLGDYNEDLMVTGDDVADFTYAWNSQDVSKEIGPTNGIPPHLLAAPDGKLDFEDLVIFVWMWNWFHQQTSFSPPGYRKNEITYFDNLITLAPDSMIEPNESKEFGLFLKDVKDAMVVSIILEYDPVKLQIESVVEGSLFSKNGADILFLRSIDNRRGMVDMACSRLQGNPLGVEGKEPAVKIQVRALIPISSEPVIAHYKIWDSQARLAYFGHSMMKLNSSEVFPGNFELFQNYPNPFNPQTDISYNLPMSLQVRVTIYNIAGQKVKTFGDEFQSAGHRTISWDGTDDKGNKVSSGIYFYQLKTDEFTQTRKMVLMK